MSIVTKTCDLNHGKCVFFFLLLVQHRVPKRLPWCHGLVVWHGLLSQRRLESISGAAHSAEDLSLTKACCIFATWKCRD